MFRKQSSDEIADIFNNLMKKNIKKTASKAESDCSMSHDEGGSLSNLAADMMINESEDEVRHHSMDEISEAKDRMHLAHDPKMASLMSGLGKIAASLRGEGEDFAADVVEATAISISKEASQKHNKTASVVSELSKIASELRPKDRFAADLVEATMSKIARDPELTYEESVQAKKDYNKLLEFVPKLQNAFHGVGHDMNMIGKANKYLTGLGTDEESVKEALSSIHDLCESGRGDNVKKYLRNLRYNIAEESDSPKLLCLKVVNEEFMKFNDKNLMETILDEMPDEFEEILVTHPELELLPKQG